MSRRKKQQKRSSSKLMKRAGASRQLSKGQRVAGKNLSAEEKPLLTKKQIEELKRAIANRPTMFQKVPLLTERPMGGKVYKVNNSGQQMVAKQYGGKVK